MIMMKRIVLTSLICAVLAGCNQVPTPTQHVNAKSVQQLPRVALYSLINRHSNSFIGQQPALSTSLNLSKAEVGNYNRVLPDYSAATTNNGTSG
jgi:hypothetical protein